MARRITRRELTRSAACSAALGAAALGARSPEAAASAVAEKSAADATQAPDAANGGDITLIVRADDLGSSHAANLACIESFRNGIVRAVEIMMPCAWVPEAVRLLAENPGIDPGVHLTLTSEWELCKWRPLTECPSLVDADGFFFPTIWPTPDFPNALKRTAWKIEEVTRELAAQIALAKREIPRLSHISGHMGCDSFDPRVRAAVEQIAADAKLMLTPRGLGRFPLGGKGATLKERIDAFAAALRALERGATYMFVEHPAYDTPEMRAIGHEGYRDVAQDRDLVTKLFTDPGIRRIIEERGIRLAGYRDAERRS